jgi:hypothetical protein
LRFQVALTTPYAVIGFGRFVPEAVEQVLPAYERAMLQEVERICSRIPHQDLANQWDVCIEMVQWDGRWQRKPFPGRYFGETFARLAAAVPEDVELGFHLCYGDLDAKHFIDPEDAGKMVELANLIVQYVQRPVTYIHLPVPIARDDDAFYAPLRNLQLAVGTEPYLGLVHTEDGAEGTRRRMASAQKYVTDFGIASECGISRGRNANVALDYLRVYAAAAET